jgi:hypothetical protein
MKARAARAAFEAGLNLANLTKIACVIEGKAMNGDLQAARMLLDYFGVTQHERDECDDERPQQGNVVQVNIETERDGRAVRVLEPNGR